MASLGNEIMKIEEEIKLLIERRDGLVRKQQDLWAGRNGLSLVHRLDSDVLRLIFEASAAHAFDQPLILGSVCQRWRATVMSTARLWGNIYIDIPGQLWSGNAGASSELLELYEERMRKKEDRLQVWLRRSGNTPLAVFFHAASFPPEKKDFVLLQIKLANIIVLHSGRWHSLTLRAPSYLRRLFGEARDLGNLQTFRLIPTGCRYSRYSPMEEGEYDVSNLVKRGSLRELLLNEVMDIDRLPIAWDHLTTLIIEPSWPIKMEMGLWILSVASRLRNCRMNLSGMKFQGEEIEEMDDTPLMLTQMESLALDINLKLGLWELEEVSGCMRGLGRVVASGLRSLHIDCHPPCRVEMVNEWPFYSLLGSTVRSLSFNLDGLHASEIVSVLTQVPALQTLALTTITPITVKEIIASLVRGVEGHVLCPKLIELRIDLRDRYNHSIDVILEEGLILLGTRSEETQETARLRKIWGRSNSFPRSRSLADRIKLMREKGFQIEWQYSTRSQMEEEFQHGDDGEDDPFGDYSYNV
ncbi:hypothetical protein VNI00_004229 [Paramarasmius palmivorus]|uniref:F-box domain-containing protein n=1 Tax=Paramarasmius palmivorus TaxID=297713 RepID=A0AAW0DPT2_9AGAR